MDEPGTFRHAAVIEYRDAPITWFYERIGFDVCKANETPDPEYIEALSGGEFRNVSIRKYSNRYGSMIEVISLPRSRVTSTASWNHVAVSVEDCESLVAELSDKGAIVVGGPVRSTSGPYLVAYVRDPSNNLVELVQRLDNSG